MDKAEKVAESIPIATSEIVGDGVMTGGGVIGGFLLGTGGRGG